MTLKLNGSSSGHVNLDAKAAAASNTLTLPDTANGELVAADSSGHINLADNKEIKLGTGGDLVLKHTGSANHIDHSNGNLWINAVTQNEQGFIHDGTEYQVRCTPDADVSLYYDNAKKFETLAGGAKVTNTAAATAELGIQAVSSQNAELWLLSDAGNQYGDKVRLLQDDGTLSIDFYTAADTWTTAATFTSTGGVTKPNLPSFRATKLNDSNGSTTLTAGNQIFYTTDWNIGSGYDTSNGKFTAPVAGKYFFWANIIYYAADAQQHAVYWKQNGSAVIQQHFTSHAGLWDGETYAGVLNMSKDDYMEFYHNAASSHGGSWSHLGGWLIH